jgi:hypothetical protein
MAAPSAVTCSLPGHQDQVLQWTLYPAQVEAANGATSSSSLSLRRCVLARNARKRAMAPAARRPAVWCSAHILTLHPAPPQVEQVRREYSKFQMVTLALLVVEGCVLSIAAMMYMLLLLRRVSIQVTTSRPSRL